MSSQHPNGIITVDPNLKGGVPCIRGLPVTVDEVADCILDGMSVEQVLSKYPALTHEDFRAVVEYIKTLPDGDGFINALYS